MLRCAVAVLVVLWGFFGIAHSAEPMLTTDATDGEVSALWVSVRVKVPAPGSSSDARGVGLVLVDPDSGPLPEGFAWDEPNAIGAIGIALDTHNPVPDKSADENGRVMGWFDGDGNWYARPEREVSVHADGTERVNVRSGFEFRTGEWIDLDAHVRFVLGGAKIVVMLDGRTVLDEHVWGVTPGRFRALAGGAGDGIEIKDLRITRTTPLGSPMPDPIRVTAYEDTLVQNAPTLLSDVDFSGVPDRVGRVIATLTLSEPEMGYDHWDKKGTVGIRVQDPEGDGYDRFEVVRFITPYRRGWTWRADVTDLLPLFKAERTLDLHIGTYMKGWLVSFALDFYEGVPEREPISVVNLWNGDAEIGNPEKPVGEFYQPRRVGVPDGATHARVRATVTGHGMHPNSRNAGEFMPIWRTLTIRPDSESAGDVLNGDLVTMSARDHLWRTDVYLNPVRPQGGTWKFDRSGWAPGELVHPWCVDVQDTFVFTDHLIVEYELDPYLNEGRGETWAPHHWTDAVIVFYREGS